ncbi:Glu-tRNA(Gln) amidotransferase GatDE subunit D [Candidatus Pacearchaeota archaeon]|nr:MAG: Glu-tRNA(Gln) amidotransferase GatDE subunit D [Candidatus Pacearchaeota archaeon]
MQKRNKTLSAQLGDYVEISLMKKDYQGVLLEVPKEEKGIILLKLDSGYNIGFKKKDVLDMRILEKGKGIEEKIEIKKDKEKPNIAMIITGGTIASRIDSKTGGVDPLSSPEELFKFYPELFKRVNVLRIEIPFMKASEDMDFKDWQKIARITTRFLNDSNIKGVIITHGTDFLHYTSAALSFFIKNLNKPIVLTYSQRSIDRASSDANFNLQCSALAAISDIAEVMVVGHASMNDDYCYAMPASKVRKLHTSRRDAFKVVNEKPFAKIFLDKIEKISDYKIRNKNKVQLDAKFEEKVVLLKVYPGQKPDILDYYVKNKYKGVVLEMSGLGHVPTKKARNSWISKLREVQNKGLIICATSQCIYGRVDPLVYSNGREILSTGVIYLEDMLSEVAFVKLGWVLGHKEWAKSKEIIKAKMLHNFTHELNDRLEE